MCVVSSEARPGAKVLGRAFFAAKQIHMESFPADSGKPQIVDWRNLRVS